MTFSPLTSTPPCSTRRPGLLFGGGKLALDHQVQQADGIPLGVLPAQAGAGHIGGVSAAAEDGPGGGLGLLRLLLAVDQLVSS